MTFAARIGHAERRTSSREETVALDAETDRRVREIRIRYAATCDLWPMVLAAWQARADLLRMEIADCRAELWALDFAADAEPAKLA